MCFCKPLSLWKFATAAIEANTPGLVNKLVVGFQERQEGIIDSG